MNILFPAKQNHEFFKNSFFPKLLVEIEGIPMIQHVIEGVRALEGRKIFLFDEEDCFKFHIDEIVRILIPEEGTHLSVRGKTGGALCTCLLACEYFNNGDELIIFNSDQVLDVDYSEVLNSFRAQGADCGVICFKSVHPRWGYVRLEGEDVVEAAVKRPISPHAIAGFYYFRRGSDFMRAAQDTMLKDASVDGVFYVASAINEMILKHKTVRAYHIAPERYMSFYSEEKVEEFIKRARAQ